MKKINYFVIFLLLLVSGNPITKHYINYQLFTSLVFLFLIIRYPKFSNYKNKREFLIYISIFSLVFYLQFIFLGFVSILGALFFLIKIFLGFIVVNVVGSNFRYIYFKLLTFISLLSLFFYCLTYFGFNLPIKLDENHSSFIIYHQILENDNFRNSGMFWEPGAFGIYINLVFILYFNDIKDLLKFHKYSVFILITALATTFSTTSYALAFIIIVSYITSKLSFKKIYLLFALAPMIVIISYIGLSSSFLLEKVNKQYDSAIANSDREFKPDRFNAMLFALHYIKKHPLIGNGFNQITRFSDHKYLQNKFLGHGNGFSNFIACMGLLSIFIYFYYIWIYSINKILILIFISVSLFGEQLLNYPLFLILPFIFMQLQSKRQK